MLSPRSTGLTQSQMESRTRMDEYNVTARKLNSELEALKQQKSTMKNQIVRTLTSIKAVQHSPLMLTCGSVGGPPFQDDLR